MKPGFLNIPKIKSYKFSYDEQDRIGFVTLYTKTNKEISYQLRNGIPCFVEFTGFGEIRYDISFPDDLHKEMFKMLKEYGEQASTNFWKGGEI